MKSPFRLRISVVSLVAVALGNAEPDAPRAFPNHPYIRSTDPTTRGACPAMNTLANHGFIPRDGKNVTVSALKTAFEEVFGFGTAVGQIFFDTAKSMSYDITLIPTTVTKEDGSTVEGVEEALTDLYLLHTPRIVEHDGSLAKQDVYFGPRPGFDQRLFDAMAAKSSDGKTLTRDDVAEHWADRIRYSRRHNPTASFFHNDDKEGWLSVLQVIQFEQLFVFMMDNDPELESVSIANLASFFGQNRIPHDYVPRKQQEGKSTLIETLEDPRVGSVFGHVGPIALTAMTEELPPEIKEL